MCVITTEKLLSVQRESVLISIYSIGADELNKYLKLQDTILLHTNHKDLKRFTMRGSLTLWNFIPIHFFSVSIVRTNIEIALNI